MASHIGLISITQWRSKRFSIQLQGMWDYIAPCNGLQGMGVQYTANQIREHRDEPLLFPISALGSNGLSHPQDEASWWSVLLKNTDVKLSSPHSANLKYQSLSPVLLTARPRHAIVYMIMKMVHLICPLTGSFMYDVFYRVGDPGPGVFRSYQDNLNVLETTIKVLNFKEIFQKKFDIWVKVN